MNSIGLNRIEENKLQLAYLVLVGRADKRPLKPAAAQEIGGNETLANKRAMAVQNEIFDRLKKSPKPMPVRGARILVLSAGATHVGAKISAEDLADDRSVSIYPHWIKNAQGPTKN